MTTLAARAGRLAADIWTPRERLTGSQWANQFGWIARSSGAAEGGPYSTSRAPYMAEILDVICDETHPDVVFNKPAQVGFTESLNQAIGYCMAHDASGVIVIQPNDGMAKAWMKERIDPMLAESRSLRGLVRSEGGRRSSDDTMQRKVFRGGWLVAVGANAPSGLRSRPARRVFGDERSGWTLDARNQGDPWDLACERTATFWNAKRVQGSTPGERGTCPITEALARSDRRRFHVACPACGHREPFTWKDADGTFRLVCDRDPSGTLIPETAQYLCRACGVLIPEYEKPKMLRGGQWVPEHPTRKLVGFDMNGLLSPWRTWAQIMGLWLDAQRDHEKLKVFVTHVLAEPHYVERERIEVHTLQARAEAMPAVPEAVGLVGVTVDVQKDRVETMAVGWGPQHEAWVLEWEQHWGDPSQPDTWDQVLAHVKAAPYAPLLGFAAFDTGYLTDVVWRQVDQWARALPRVRTFGLKGMGGPGRQLITKPGKATDRRRKSPWLVGTDTAKDALLSHGLRVPVPPGGPGAVHFADTLDPAFFAQLTAESPTRVQLGGRTAVVWRKLDASAANEALDLLVYNLGAVVAMTTHFHEDLARRSAARRAPAPVATPAVTQSKPASTWLRGRRGGWL